MRGKPCRAVPPALSKHDVVHVAKLARLDLGDAEIEPLLGELGKILDHVAMLAELDTENVPPTAQVAVERLPVREDAVVPGLPAETALAEAPRSAGGAFAVPAFVEEG